MLFTPSFFFALLRCAFPLPYMVRTEFTEGLQTFQNCETCRVYNVNTGLKTSLYSVKTERKQTLILQKTEQSESKNRLYPDLTAQSAGGRNARRLY